MNAKNQAASGPISDDEIAAFLHDLMMAERDNMTEAQTAQAMAGTESTAARILDAADPMDAALIAGLREGYGASYGLRLHQEGQALCVVADPDSEQGRAIHDLAERLAALASDGVSVTDAGPLQ